MPDFLSYFKSMEAFDGAPEGEGTPVIEFSVEGFGIHVGRSYLSARLQLQVSGTAEPATSGKVTLPKLKVEAYNANIGKLTLQSLRVESEGYQEYRGDVSIYLQVSGYGYSDTTLKAFLPAFSVLAQGANETRGVITFPFFQLAAYGGPPVKVYQLCYNENYGL